MELVIHFNSIANCNESSNSFYFNYKFQLGLWIMSNQITKVIDNADHCSTAGSSVNNDLVSA